MSVEGKTHSDVVVAIKAGGSEVRLLVVDPDTDAFFKRCKVVASMDHLAGERTHGQAPCLTRTELMTAIIL